MTATYSFCQNIYPKIIEIEKDTVIAITVDQMKKINTDIILLDKLKTEVKLLNTSLSQKDSTISNLKLVYSNCLKIDSTSNQQFLKLNEIIDLQAKNYEEMKLVYKQENILLKKEVRKTNLKLSLTNISILLTGILVIGFIVK